MKPAEIARIIGQAEMAGAGHYTPILQRVMRAEMNVCFPTRETAMPPLYRLSKKGRPVLLLLGDDDYADAGPDTWACSAKVREWASFAIIHGTGAQRMHYEMAAELAMQVRKLLFIETTSAAAQQWAAFLYERTSALPCLGLLPSNGAHPVMPAKGDVH